MRFCLILIAIVPAFAASQDHAETIVRADQKSGRLIRTTIPIAKMPVEPISIVPRPVEVFVAGARLEAQEAPVTALADTLELAAFVDRIAAEMGVEDSLVHSVIRAESNYNARAVSPKGAQGMMQLIPATARRFGVTNAFDARDNIQGGVRYLKFLLDYYQNDYAKTIAAYNAGEGAVDRYHGVPPFVETQNYVVRVARNLKTARLARTRALIPAKVLIASAGDATYQPIHTSLGDDGRVYYRTP